MRSIMKKVSQLMVGDAFAFRGMEDTYIVRECKNFRDGTTAITYVDHWNEHENVGVYEVLRPSNLLVHVKSL
jgi:hypothetical protein